MGQSTRREIIGWGEASSGEGKKEGRVGDERKEEGGRGREKEEGRG